MKLNNIDKELIAEKIELQSKENKALNSDINSNIIAKNVKVEYDNVGLDLFDKFAKNLEFVQYDGTKKIFKTHFDIENDFLPDYRESIIKLSALDLSNFCNDVLYRIDKEIQDENIKKGIMPKGFILK